MGQTTKNQDALTKLSWWARQSFVTCTSMLIVVVCNTWQIKDHDSKLIDPSIEQKINQLKALMESRWKWKGLETFWYESKTMTTMKWVCLQMCYMC